MSLQPVYDAETPRCERDDDSASMQKHRAFDNPWALKVILLLHLSPPFLNIFQKERKRKERSCSHYIDRTLLSNDMVALHAHSTTYAPGCTIPACTPRLTLDENFFLFPFSFSLPTLLSTALSRPIILPAKQGKERHQRRPSTQFHAP